MRLPEPVYAKDIKKDMNRMSPEGLKSSSGRLGMRLGALAALVRILELRVEELEGSEGTGSMEDDLMALGKAQSAEQDEASIRRLACMVYR